MEEVKKVRKLNPEVEGNKKAMQEEEPQIDQRVIDPSHFYFNSSC